MSLLQNAISEAVSIFQTLDGFEPRMEEAAGIIGESLVKGHKLLVCGNGGSASDAAHFATEFVCRFMGERRPYPAICLSAEGGLLTAVGNDYHFEELFARQVWAFGNPGDVLVVLSTSGKSRNVLRALEEANRKRIRSIAFLGKDGGFTAGLATVEFIVPGSSTARIQEAQKLLYHVLCEMVEGMLPRA